MRIELLPAMNGDCILAEYISQHFILIDGGYVDTYQKYLLPRLKEIAAGGGVVDLIVVTHIDGDHISGIIKLLEEDELPIEVHSIWYNGYRHVQSFAKISEVEEAFIHKNICKEKQSDELKPVSAQQGCTLSALITRRGIKWNAPVNGQAIKAPLSVSLRDAIIHILSPGRGEIENLERFWKKRLIKDGLLNKAHSEKYWDDAFEFSLSRDMPGFHFHEKKVSKSYNLQEVKKEQYVPDNSVTNGSSISFVLETEGERLLFLGDAHSETVVNSLQSLYGKDNGPYKFDVVKLAHHGSYNNNSPELFNIIESDKWIISTNGDKYNHPDLPTLAHIITKCEGNKLFFNYDLPVCKELNKDIYHESFSFEIIVPEGDNGIQIEIR